MLVDQNDKTLLIVAQRNREAQARTRKGRKPQRIAMSFPTNKHGASIQLTLNSQPQPLRKRQNSMSLVNVSGSALTLTVRLSLRASNLHLWL